MTRAFLALLLVLPACTAAHDAAAPRPGEAAPAEAAAVDPPAVILFIGDGAGLSYWSAARLATSTPLAVENLPVVGLVDTRSSRSRVTDSAAGATAFASGVRTFNGAVGVGPDSARVATVLEVARSRGWAAGLVATSSITHATPAAFVAHVPDRAMYDRIAEHIAADRPEVLLGGGRRFFDPEQRADGLDLLTPIRRGAVYVEDDSSFQALRADTIRALVGLFADQHPGPAPVRSPALPELTRAALRVLAQDEDGFFLMVEGSQIDWRGHDNAPFRDVLAEVQDLDMAVREALEFQRRRPNTLILVTADHETGGLSLHPGGEAGLTARYTTTGHTAGMVPLFAGGPGAAAFGGIIDNDRVGRLLLQIVRDAGAASAPETDRPRAR